VAPPTVSDRFPSKSSATWSAGRSGFTLLELVIALLIFGILLALAVPTYQRYAARAARADAVRALMTVATCQERIRAAEGFYDPSRCGDAETLSHYRIRLGPADESRVMEFRVVAEPLDAAAGDTCGALSLDETGARRVSGTASVADCWGGR